MTQTIMRIIAVNIESRTSLSIALRTCKDQVRETRSKLLRQCLGAPLTQVLPISLSFGSMYNQSGESMHVSNFTTIDS